MATKRPLKSKAARKRQSKISVPAIPYGLVSLVLGLILITAGATKIYASVFDTLDESLGTVVLVFFFEAEVLGGIWMVARFATQNGRRWVLFGFVGLALSNLFLASSDKCSCSWFNGLSISHGYVLLFDLAAIAALSLFRAKAEPKPVVPDLWHFARLALIALVIGIVGWRQSEMVTVGGIATEEHRLLADAALILTGPSGKVSVRANPMVASVYLRCGWVSTPYPLLSELASLSWN